MTAVSEATLTLTREEADVLVQALDLLASDPGLISDQWPNTEDDSVYEALGLAAFDLSSRVRDLINGETTPCWIAGLRAAMGR